MTEHPTAEGKLYCAAVMDAYSRLIVGWSIADHMRTDLVTGALGMAIIRRQPDKHADENRTILHSDHGSPNTRRGRSGTDSARPGCSPRWALWAIATTALAENLWSTIQVELVYWPGTTFATRAEAEHALVRYIDGWYKPRRTQAGLGGLSPDEYEDAYHRAQHGPDRRRGLRQSGGSSPGVAGPRVPPEAAS